MKVQNCKHCGREYAAERKERQYCSSSCCYADRRGKPRGPILTAEGKARLSQLKTGSKLSSEHKAAISAGLAKAYADGRAVPHPTSGDEWRENIGKGLKLAYAEGRKRIKVPGLKGPKSPNWKGGITPYFTKIRNAEAMQRWRRRVFSRDNYTCLKCGARNGHGKHVDLQAHHIMPLKHYPVLAYDENNGATLCVPCHQQITRKGI